VPQKGSMHLAIIRKLLLRPEPPLEPNVPDSLP
jgi:hypothetical protein